METSIDKNAILFGNSVLNGTILMTFTLFAGILYTLTFSYTTMVLSLFLLFYQILYENCAFNKSRIN